MSPASLLPPTINVESTSANVNVSVLRFFHDVCAVYTQPSFYDLATPPSIYDLRDKTAAGPSCFVAALPRL